MSDLVAGPAARPSLFERVDPSMMLLVAWSTVAIASLLAGDGTRQLGIDDAMRLVEVRDLLSGQAWGDLVQHRLAPPDGVSMHWSRLVDAPLAAMLLVLKPLFGSAIAESVMMTAWPLGLMAILAALVMRAADVLAGRTGALLALALLALSGPSLVHFMPGSIDHHNVQLVLTLAMTVCAMRSKASPRLAAVAGSLGALSLAVGLEMLPAVAVCGAVMAIALVAYGAAFSRAAASFGLGLALTAVAVRVVTPGPALLGPAVCDAFAAPVLMLCVLGGAALLIGAAVSGRLAGHRRASPASRAWGPPRPLPSPHPFPNASREPYRDLDPRLAALWLAKVAESQSIVEALRMSPELIAPIAPLSSWRSSWDAPCGDFRFARGEAGSRSGSSSPSTAAHWRPGRGRSAERSAPSSPPRRSWPPASPWRSGRDGRARYQGCFLVCLCLSPVSLMAIGAATKSAVLASTEAPAASLIGLPTCSSRDRPRAPRQPAARKGHGGHRPRPQDPRSNGSQRVRRPLSPQRRRQHGPDRHDGGDLEARPSESSTRSGRTISRFARLGRG